MELQFFAKSNLLRQGNGVDTTINTIVYRTIERSHVERQIAVVSIIGQRDLFAARLQEVKAASSTCYHKLTQEFYLTATDRSQ